jgi:hypothetical protein
MKGRKSSSAGSFISRSELEDGNAFQLKRKIIGEALRKVSSRENFIAKTFIVPVESKVACWEEELCALTGRESKRGREWKAPSKLFSIKETLMT